jgi:hypothetical protein
MANIAEPTPYVGNEQQTPPLHRPKESSKGATGIRFFVFAFILLPVCVLTVAYIIAPDSWEIRKWPGTVAALCCLAFVFALGVYIVKLGPKIPRTVSTPPSWPELAIWFCFEILYWLVLFLVL